MVDVGGIVWTADINTGGLTDAERRVDRSTRNITRDFERTETAANRVGGAIKRMAAGISAAIAVRQVLAYGEAWTKVQNQLRVVTDGQEDLAQVSQRIIDISRDTRASLEGTSQLYSRFRRGVDETVVSDERLLGVTKTINQALAVSGATAAESEGALRQLAQGLASGALRGEEFNSVSEQAPGILRAVSMETGKTVGELREFAATGGITSELLITALEKYADVAEREFAGSTRTMSQSLEVARTNAIEFVGQTNALTSAVGLAGDGVVFLSENLDTLVKIAGAGAAVFGARFVGSLATSTAAFIAAQVQASRYQATLASMAGVSRTAAAGQIALAGAVRGVQGALSLVGGPAGAIFLVISGLAMFMTSAKDTSSEVEDLTRNFDLLTDAQRRNAQQTLVMRQSELQIQIRELNKEIAEEQKKLEELGTQTRANHADFVILTSSLAELRGKLINAGTSLGEVEDGLADVNTALEGTPETADAAAESIAGVGAAAEGSLTPLDAVIKKLEYARMLVKAGGEGDADPFAFEEPEEDKPKDDKPQDPGTIGLTRIESLEAQYERERQILQEAREAGIESKIGYEQRLTELQQQYADQRAEIMKQEEMQKQSAMLGTLKETSSIFGDMASLTKAFLGEQSSTYKKMFAISKAFSIASSIIAIKTGIAQAAALPFPANLIAMATVAASTAGLVSDISGVSMGGGRLYGGPVDAGSMYPVNEDGRPEMLVQNGRQYLLPGARGEVINNKEMTNNNSGGNITVNQTFQGGQGMDAQQLRNMVFDSNVQDAIYSIMQKQSAKRGKRL